MTSIDHEKSLEELKKEKLLIASQLQAKDDEINKRIQAQRAQIIQETKAVIKEYDLSQAELFGAGSTWEPQEKTVRKTRIKYSVARYIGEKGEEWYGTGTHPQWLVTALASGKKNEELENPEWTKLYGSVKDKKKKPAKSVAPEQAAA